MFQKKLLVFCGVLFLASASAFSWEITERYRLGAMVEGTTFIDSGSLAGKVAFVDGWSVYVNDLNGGEYEKLFSLEPIHSNFQQPPRGIAYLSQGEFAGNFLLSDIGNATTLFIVSSTGSLVSAVRGEDLEWTNCEGLTEIPSGTYAGMIAIVAHSTDGWHILIFRMEGSDGLVKAKREKDIPLASAYPGYYATGLTFLPQDHPAYPNHFVLAESPSESPSYLTVIGEDGAVHPQRFSSVPLVEGLTYISSGIHEGKFLIADYRASETAIANLDGSDSKRIPISVGLGLHGAQSMTWLTDRQQLFLTSWNGLLWEVPTYLISRFSAGQWAKDKEFTYTRLRSNLNVTDMTKAGTYYLKGRADALHYEIHRLNAEFGWMETIELPDEYLLMSFGPLVYVPGATEADDRFLLPNNKEKRLYSFGAEFTYPAETLNVYGKLENLGPLCYDPEVRRFYALDRGPTLRVFDQSWNQLAVFDIKGLFSRGFSDITKFTSGALKGNVALLNTGDNELVIVNFEYEIASGLLGTLSRDVLASEIKTGLAKELAKELSVAAKSVESKRLPAAVNQVREFQASVREQIGRGISAALADAWLTRSEEIIRGLSAL
ncbi:MAG: hypothetical protein ACM3NQ_06350 [Bacteroidales bacterium]